MGRHIRHVGSYTWKNWWQLELGSCRAACTDAQAPLVLPHCNVAIAFLSDQGKTLFFTENRLIWIGHSAQVFSSTNRWEVTPQKAWTLHHCTFTDQDLSPFLKAGTDQRHIIELHGGTTAIANGFWNTGQAGLGQQEEENSDGHRKLSASLENWISSCPWRDFYQFKPLS